MSQTDDYRHTRINPQNIPHARYIEKFWGALGQKDFANGWETKKFEQLVGRIKFKLKVFKFSKFSNPQKKKQTGCICDI